MKLQLEVNPEVEDGEPIRTPRGGAILVTPTLDESYWTFRVKLSNKQAIVGFPKFLTIGIGFQVEEDWNTNLPYTTNAEQIYSHIEHNKKDKSISKENCVKAIKMIQKVAKFYIEGR